MKKVIKFARHNFVLILILLLFLFSRLYKISEIPGSVYWDEASIGYNAYSVLTTGKDEWGETLPLHFRAFGEFKLPVYIYSVLITESVFGLSPLAVRLPSVLYGLLAVVGLYLLVFEISQSKLISLLSSFLFTITPWFFIFSRTGYEATAGLAFFIWGIYTFLKFKDKKWEMLIPVILFLISAYSYNSFRILTPLVLIPILISKFNKKNLTPLVISGSIILASLVPIYRLYKQDSGLGRLQTVGTSKNLVSNYLKNFSPEFLFTTGDTNPRSQIPGSGQLYYLDAVFILLGLIFIYKSKNFKLLFILVALLLAPIPASITYENPHALRAILMAPTLSVLSAMGIYYLMQNYKKYKKIILTAVVVLYALSFEGYFYKFGNDYNKLSSSAWQGEYKQIFTNQNEGCVSDQYAQPYIFALFYGKDGYSNQTDPEYFRETRVLNDVSDWGFSTVASFGNYTFPKNCYDYE